MVQDTSLVDKAPGLLGSELAFAVSRLLSEAMRDIDRVQPVHRDRIAAKWVAFLRHLAMTFSATADQLERKKDAA